MLFHVAYPVTCRKWDALITKTHDSIDHKCLSRKISFVIIRSSWIHEELILVICISIVTSTLRNDLTIVKLAFLKLDSNTMTQSIIAWRYHLMSSMKFLYWIDDLSTSWLINDGRYCLSGLTYVSAYIVYRRKNHPYHYMSFRRRYVRTFHRIP